MKKILIAALLATAFLLPAVTPAQTSSNELTVASFPATAQAYFTSFNTNFCWTNITLSMATGYKQVTGVNAASTVDGAFYFGSTKQWNVGAAFQFSGVGSAFNAYEAQVGYDLIQHYDAELEADLRGGYDNNKSAGVVEPALFIKKKPTVNTFFETGISLPVFFKGRFNSNPTFFIETGFTY